MVSIVVMEGEREVERPSGPRPVRRLPDGTAAAVYKKRAYPLYAGNFINLNDNPQDKDTCGYFNTTEKINYASSKIAPVQKTLPAASPTKMQAVISVTQTPSTEVGQSEIVNAKAGARLLVDAGPGTGKTKVACDRVAALVKNSYLPPAKIWLISFTRTAVHEIRGRISELLDRGIANAVQISTLDSMAWKVRKAHTHGATIDGGFESNIKTLIEKIDEDVSVRDYLLSIRHLIIDEAQDVVGARADLLLKLIRELDPECGVTVFSDEAQAIYGFSVADEDFANENEEPLKPLPVLIRESEFHETFDLLSMSEIHRTSDPTLKKIYSDVRKKVLCRENGSKERYQSVRQDIQSLAQTATSRNVDEIIKQDLKTENSFILFRRRIEAVQTSSDLLSKGIPHRLRMSGLPITMAPWIAATLGEVTDVKIDEDTFTSLWKNNVSGTCMDTGDPSSAFDLLRRTACDATGKLIDMRALRKRLSRNPPMSLYSAEVGRKGQLIGTIHASKGREADYVSVMLPATVDNLSDAAVDEESRVLFVAASRARKQVFVQEAESIPNIRTEGGRVYRFGMKKIGGDTRRWCNVEIGRAGDICVSGIAGRSYYSDADTVRKNIRSFISMAAEIKGVEAYLSKVGEDWRFVVKTDYNEKHFAVFSEAVKSDLEYIQNKAGDFFKVQSNAKRLKKMAGFYIAGLTTLAIHPEDSLNEELLDPWKTSGLVLAPLVSGFPICSVKFND